MPTGVPGGMVHVFAFEASVNSVALSGEIRWRREEHRISIARLIGRRHLSMVTSLGLGMRLQCWDRESRH
jgi:hypothetical protein